MRRQQVGHWCDRAIIAGLGFVIVFGPFAFGAIHPWAYGLLEVVAALLVLVWVGKLEFWGTPSEKLPTVPREIWIPVAGFLSIAVLQVVPLPPGVLRVISPATYEMYATALPGWPDKAPYEEVVRDLIARDDLGVQAAALSRPVSLPTARDVERFGLDSIVPDAWGRLPGEPLLEHNERSQLERWVDRDHNGFASSWRTLSIDPARTAAELLKILTYLALFSVVSFYPLARGSREDTRFQRRLLRILAFTAIAVAAVGLLQRFAWNGRILWVFVPWDWGVPRPTSPQTSGPFVSRNNFGGYLALTLPLVLVPFLTPSRMDLRGRRTWTRVLFGAGAALTAAALLFSLSRGAWVASAVSIGVLLLGLSRRLAPEQLPRFLRSKRAGAAAACACAAAILFLILVPTGGSELGSDIDRRLEQSVTNSVSWDSRAAFWLDSLPMIGDFAAFGVGLGSWGAIFPRYDGSFFFGTQARRAHNDYVQLLSETGILGALLLLGACVAIGVRLHRATRERSEDALAPGLAIGAGLVALAIHEFVDFDLQMPGIAVTATVLLGLGLRGSWRGVAREGAWARLPAVLALASIVYLGAVLMQPALRPYTPVSPGVVAALRAIDRRPTESPAHLALGVELAEVGPGLARPALDAAVELNPNSPGPRDARAVVVAQLGEEEQALRDIEESMFRAPARSQHPLFLSTAVAWLPLESRTAAERGLKRAVDGAGYRAAMALAGFYSGVHDRKAAAVAWEQAAELSPKRPYAATMLRLAGLELTRAGEWGGAEELLERSIDLDPGAFPARALLISQVLARRPDLSEARAQVQEGIEAGADSYELDLALAEAARGVGDAQVERSVLEAAAAQRPNDVRGHYRLGLSYYRAKLWDKAARSMDLATRAAPDYGPAWFYLGLTSENAYRFDAAERAFKRALVADPEDDGYRRHYDRFLVRLKNG